MDTKTIINVNKNGNKNYKAVWKMVKTVNTEVTTCGAHTSFSNTAKKTYECICKA